LRGVENSLARTCLEKKWPPGWDADDGWGIVDADAALNSAAGSNSAPVADAGADQLPCWQ